VGPGDRPVKLTRSDDDGVTWSAVTDETESLQPPGTSWDAMGPGVGIQTSCGPVQGRLVVPAIGRNIYSDDHGLSWSHAPIPAGSSEGTLVELSTGSLLRNDRAVGGTWDGYRLLSRGVIPEGFEDLWPHETLIDPRVEGSSLRYSSAPHRVLFLNPANNASDDLSARCKMRVRISYDDGATWPVSRLLHDPLSEAETCSQHLGGYSSMAATSDGHVVALSERIEAGSGSHRGIELHRFNLSWVLNGTAEPL
jgi:sialidase-1